MTSLALVVPCHNEFRRLQPETFLSALERYPWLSLCFVDDGSSDATADTLAFLSKESPSVHALYLPRNGGKAEAVRAGARYLLDYTHTDAVGFWDADLATPLDELPSFMEELRRHPDCGAVFGSRWPHLGARIVRSAARHLSGEIMRFLIRRVLRAPVYDTQCGAKIFTRGLAREIFSRPFVSRWLFDVELLKRAAAVRPQVSVRELPLSCWYDVPGSNLGLKDALAVFHDLLRVAVDKPSARAYNGPSTVKGRACAF